VRLRVVRYPFNTSQSIREVRGQHGAILLPSEKSNVVVPSPRPVAAREIQLIDRAKEMEVLRDAANSAIRGAGGIVLLHGEAGIGKTRLARELGAYAQSQGMRVLSGRCPALFRMDGVPPYVLWEEVIRDYLEACTPEQLFRVIGSYPIEVSKLVPELRQKLTAFPQSFPLSPEHSRDRLYEAVAQFVTNISKETPLLIILDDLQWTDKSSLLLLQYIARGALQDSLLILGAYRDTDTDENHPLSAILAELNRERLLHSVQLKRMAFGDVSDMIARMLGQDNVPREFCELVFEKTRGNPFFVEEVIRSLKEEEILYLEGDEWRTKEVASIEFPKTVKNVIKKRISRLDDECHQVMTMASFIGKDFTPEALHSVTGLAEEQLFEIMDKLIKTGLFKQEVIRGEDVCSFADIIVRDVVHEEVGHFKRKQLHGAVGHALETLYAQDIDEHLGELALHFLESGEREKALDYFLRAGDKAASVYANNEAASYFQSALQYLEEQEGTLPQRAQVLERIGDIKKLVGECDNCLRNWKAALLLREQLNEKVKVARLHRKMANLLWDTMGEAKKAESHHEEAMRVLEAEPESIELAGLYEDMAHMYYRTGDLTKALSSVEKALELARTLNASEVIASSYASLGTIHGFAGDSRKSVECFERGLEQALDNGHIETALRIYNNLPILLRASVHSAEDYQRSLELFEQGLKLAKEVGDIHFLSWLEASLAEAYVGMANIDKALLLAEESVTLDRKAQNLVHLSMSLSTLGFIQQVRGEWDEAEQYYNEALQVSQRLADFQSIAMSYGYLGWLHFDKGEYGTAREYLETVLKTLEQTGVKPWLAPTPTILIWTYIELGQFKQAESLIERMHEYASEANNRMLAAQADALRAMLSRGQKKWSDSFKHFEESLRAFEALNSQRWDAYRFAKSLLYEYARVYLERGQEGDREKAHELLTQALDLFQKIGTKKEIAKTKSELARLEPEQAEAKPAPVTEVALPKLITTGYEDLDALLRGGIPRTYAVILTSPSCDERDLLVKRFLEAGAQNGHPTFHVTARASGIENLAQEFPSDFYLFVCNPQADKIVKSLPNVTKLKGVENLTNINIALTSAFHKLDATPRTPRRICVEIVSDVLLQHHTVQTRKWVNALLPELKSKGFTTLAVMDSEIHPRQEIRAIAGIFEGEIDLHDKETAEGPQKFVTINRMANHEYSDKGTLLRRERLASKTK
jgi:tetratricopeptide (TPR) repeat protein/KaiC/GvpD/RAD55 family RecA-like ATPase